MLALKLTANSRPSRYTPRVALNAKGSSNDSPNFSVTKVSASRYTTLFDVNPIEGPDQQFSVLVGERMAKSLHHRWSTGRSSQPITSTRQRVPFRRASRRVNQIFELETWFSKVSNQSLPPQVCAFRRTKVYRSLTLGF